MTKRTSQVASTYANTLYEAEEMGLTDPRTVAEENCYSVYRHTAPSIVRKGIEIGRKTTLLNSECAK